jgi:superfamily I DNA/RNA helicase
MRVKHANTRARKHTRTGDLTVRKRLQIRLQYLLVDEYQDVSALQYDLIVNLTEPDRFRVLTLRVTFLTLFLAFNARARSLSPLPASLPLLSLPPPACLPLFFSQHARSLSLCVCVSQYQEVVLADHHQTDLGYMVVWILVY